MSSINVILTARSYALLYSALKELQFAIPQMVLQKIEQNGTLPIAVQVVADNHVDFGGLRVTLVYVSIYFQSSDSSVFRNRPLQEGWTLSRIVSPKSSTTIDLVFLLTQNNASALLLFYANHPNDVAANAYLVVGVSSFLYILSGQLSYYPASQNLTLA